MLLANQRLPRVTQPPHRGRYIIMNSVHFLKYYLMILLLAIFSNTSFLDLF
jgi:hypothetical protein